LIPTITPAEVRSQGHLRSQLVDVRSASEFAAGHIPGAVNIPMDQIEARLDDLYHNVPVVLVCQMGKRAEMTAHLLEPCRREISILAGGTNASVEAGLPLVRSVKTRWSLERQVRLGAGLLVLTGVVLARVLNPAWVVLSGFIGVGLIFAGLTDLCPMAMLLEKLPWNHNVNCKTANSIVEPMRSRR
jgi:rhodanese-related sulfurtransferase